MKAKTRTTTVRVLLILFTLILTGIFLVLRTRTLVNPWLVGSVALFFSLPLSFLCASRNSQIIPFRNLPLRIAAWAVVLTPVLAGLFYGINYQGASIEDSQSMGATVERKYSETRKRTRRVGRGRYVPTGETYQVHYADIRLDNGHLMTIPLTGRRIHEMRNGRQINVNVARGSFGIPVVITKNIFKQKISDENQL